jgi:hypothetical protein
MARRSSSSDGCAWFLLLVIASVIIGNINGAGIGWLVFFMVWFFVAIA